MTIDEIRGNGALGLVGEAKLLPDPADAPVREKPKALVPGLGKVDLQAGALETFMKLKGIELETGMSSEQIKVLLRDGLAMASEIGESKADALQQRLDEIATTFAEAFLRDLGVKLGPGPFDCRQASILVATGPGWDTISPDSPLAKALGARFAEEALRSRVVDLLNSVLAPVNLVASIGACAIAVAGRSSGGPPTMNAPEKLTEAFVGGQDMAVARRTAIINAAMFAAAEIVAQVTTKLKIATDNDIDPLKGTHSTAKIGESGPQKITFEVDPDHAPSSVAKDWAWATKRAPSELWKAIADLVQIGFSGGLGSDLPYHIVSVASGGVVVAALAQKLAGTPHPGPGPMGPLESLRHAARSR